MIGVFEHFILRVEIIDIVECIGLWGARKGWRTELVSAVMGGNEVKEVEADELRRGLKGFPRFCLRRVCEVAP